MSRKGKEGMACVTKGRRRDAEREGFEEVGEEEIIRVAKEARK